jgi:hypothetical protein
MPPQNDDSPSQWVQSISNNLGAVFRHLFPGVLVIGAADVAHPSWFYGIDTSSWQHILVIAVVALALGNTWFAINRYGVHQLLDYAMYLFRWRGPARTTSWFQFHDDLGKYVAHSLCNSTVPPSVRQHVAFRASSVLLLYIVAEIGLLATFSHEPKTLFERHPQLTPFGSVLIFLVAFWQDAITRRIDYYVVDFEKKNLTPKA